jgi:hypothetical protein
MEIYNKPVTPTIVIELTPEEAQQLKAILGMGHSMTGLYNALVNHLRSLDDGS